MECSKQQILENLLTLGKVQIIVMRCAGAVFPNGDGLLAEQIVPIFLSWQFCKPMELTADGVLADLTFNGVEHHCFFPWESICAICSMVDANQRYRFSGDRCIEMPAEQPSARRPNLKLVC